jgi:O-antigen/teichoic acid export membrane protein
MTPSDTQVWGPPDRPLQLLARNVSTRYLAILTDGAIGLVLLPFNVAHLGPSAYGLWALTTSVTWFFGVLDLGYGSALVKFIAQYRAWRDHKALNEILSTIGLVFAGLGAVCFLVTALLAWRVDWLFNIDAGQARTARPVLLIIGIYLSLRFPLSIFGAVVYGFQRYYLNNAVSIGVSLAVAAVNVAVLSSGHGLVMLVAAILDWSAKLNYSTDTLVIGAMLDTTAVAVWTVGQRLAQVAQQLTSQLNSALFPSVVDSDAADRPDRLQMILVHGTKLSLAVAAPLCLGMIVLADPLIRSWVGPHFSASVLPTQILLTVVLVRISAASADLILRGAGQHKLLTYSNAATAVVNLTLSLALVRPFGLLGVALGTLIPVSVSAAFVLYPAACRRVGLPFRRPLVEAIWPAMWPAVIMVGLLWIGRRVLPAGLIWVALLLAAGGLVYVALFLGLAIGAEERSFYWTKLRGLASRQRRAPAAA